MSTDSRTLWKLTFQNESGTSFEHFQYEEPDWDALRGSPRSPWFLYGEKIVVDKESNVLEVSESTMDPFETLKRILGSFDIDISAEGSHFTGLTYTARLWHDNSEIAQVSGPDLAELLRKLDQDACAFANYG
jgi:hypothetical protein